MEFIMPNFSLVGVWMSLLTLTFLEIVLGIDNIIFISIAANKLPESQRPRATNIGLLLAMLMRIVLLLGVSVLVAMKDPWFYLGDADSLIQGGFSGQSLILIAGGLFLLKAPPKFTTSSKGRSITLAPVLRRSKSLSLAIFYCRLHSLTLYFHSIPS